MPSQSRTLLLGLFLSLALGLLPGCSSCAGESQDDSPPARTEEQKQSLRGFQRMRVTRTDLLLDAGGASPAPSASAHEGGP